jgi:hypothetical protein
VNPLAAAITIAVLTSRGTDEPEGTRKVMCLLIVFLTTADIIVFWRISYFVHFCTLTAGYLRDYEKFIRFLKMAFSKTHRYMIQIDTIMLLFFLSYSALYDFWNFEIQI